MWRKREIMIHTDEDDEFERIMRENKMKGQPYHYESKRIWIDLSMDELTDLFYNKNLDRMSAVNHAIALLKERNT
jgi:hypothetical protein